MKLYHEIEIKWIYTWPLSRLKLPIMPWLWSKKLRSVTITSGLKMIFLESPSAPLLSICRFSPSETISGLNIQSWNTEVLQNVAWVFVSSTKACSVLGVVVFHSFKSEFRNNHFSFLAKSLELLKVSSIFDNVVVTVGLIFSVWNEESYSVSLSWAVVSIDDSKIEQVIAEVIGTVIPMWLIFN